MKVKSEDTPNSYQTIRVVESYEFDNEDRSIDVNKCTTSEDEVFFHVVHQPPMDEIESHKDIITITSFTIGDGETEEEVKRQADNSAREYYADTDV